MSSPHGSPTPFARMDEEAEPRTSTSPSLNGNDDGGDINMVPMKDQSGLKGEIEQPSGASVGSTAYDVPEYDNFDVENDLRVYHGHADFDLELQQVSNSKWNFGKTKRGVIKVCYISVFAILGSLLRIILAQLFGEECRNPGTVGWLKAGQPLCVTADGEASLEGGIIFADLPANLLGSFVMGFMQSTDTMDLPKTFPIAWLPDSSSFQSYDIIHFAIKTGFCGALTTFSSWNSEMVLMMLGVDNDRGSLIFRGFLGYFIGVETALASFMLGKNVAKYVHSIVNEDLHHEAMETRKKKERGVYINTQLADFERRFLSEFDMGMFEIETNPVAVGYLSRWRESTRENRRVGNQLLPLLTDIEYQVLVLDEDIELDETVRAAIMAKWDLESLKKWREIKRHLDIMPVIKDEASFRFGPAFNWCLVCLVVLIAAIIFENGMDDYSMTYRTMALAALLAPTGALIRWRMSNWNGKWTKHSWFPLGTMAANLTACIISVTMIALELKLYDGTQSFWLSGTTRALKVGMAGSLSTVSTFINEVASFLSSDHPVHGYAYIACSIITCGLAGTIFYVTIAHAVEPDVYYRGGGTYGY
jgi:fluoride ion exporter CrcB/FEX